MAYDQRNLFPHLLRLSQYSVPPVGITGDKLGATMKATTAGNASAI